MAISRHLFLSKEKRLSFDKRFSLVQGAGFEPAKPKVADLQSAVFDRSTTPANYNVQIISWSRLTDSNRGPTVYKTAALTY